MAEKRQEETGGDAAAELVCAEIGRQLEGSWAMAEEVWQREMEEVLGRMQRAKSAVFEVTVEVRRVWRRLVHVAAWFGSRAVLEEACTRTGSSPAKVAQILDSHRNTMLHLAVRNHRLSVEDIQWVVSLHSAATSTANRNSSFPLHLLAWKHKCLTPDLVDVVLLPHHQALEVADLRGALPLHYACINPDLTVPVLRHLLSLWTAAACTTNKTENLPLHLLVANHTALTAELVDVLLEIWPTAPQSVNQRGNLPLHCACLNPHMTTLALRHLISLHSAAAGTPNKNSRLPLQLLVANHGSLSAELVEVMLEAHPEVLQTAAPHGYLPLHRACENPRMTAQGLSHLLSLHPAAASAPSQQGELPLHHLVANHETLTPELVDLVAQAAPQAVQCADQRGFLPLHFACCNPHASAPALRHLSCLHAAAAGTATKGGALPLHLLVWKCKSLTLELLDTVLSLHPEGVHTPDDEDYLPLRYACDNPHISAPALRHLMCLHAEGARTTDLTGSFPLHILVWTHRSLTAEMVDVVLNAYPRALQSANQQGDLPLHHACNNACMTEEALHSVLLPFPEALAIPNSAGRVPYHSLHVAMPDCKRHRLARILMEATDRLFPCKITSSSSAAPPLSSDETYAPPLPGPHWVSHKHPLSQQGRLKAGLRVAVRGRENVWQFQTGGRLPGRAAADDMSLAELACAGHLRLVQERLAVPSAATDINGVDEAVLRALELGHEDVARELLTHRPSAEQPSCTAEQACKWLAALMRPPPAAPVYGWLLEWMYQHRAIWDGREFDLNWWCLGAAALSGQLTSVERMAAIWQAQQGGAPAIDVGCEELGARAVTGGSVAVLHWLQRAGLATYSTQQTFSKCGSALAKHDQLDMIELLQQKRQLGSASGTVRGAVEGGALRVLRWLHVHTRIRMNAPDLAAAIYHGHAAVVQFLHRHRNINQVPQDDVLAKAVQHSAPGTLAVVEYVLRHDLCGDDGVTKQVVVSACAATTVRVEVARFLVSRASGEVLGEVDDELARLGLRQAQDVFRAARHQVSPRY